MPGRVMLKHNLRDYGYGGPKHLIPACRGVAAGRDCRSRRVFHPVGRGRRGFAEGRRCRAAWHGLPDSRPRSSPPPLPRWGYCGIPLSRRWHPFRLPRPGIRRKAPQPSRPRPSPGQILPVARASPAGNLVPRRACPGRAAFRGGTGLAAPACRPTPARPSRRPSQRLPRRMSLPCPRAVPTRDLPGRSAGGGFPARPGWLGWFPADRDRDRGGDGDHGRQIASPQPPAAQSRRPACRLQFAVRRTLPPVRRPYRPWPCPKRWVSAAAALGRRFSRCRLPRGVTASRRLFCRRWPGGRRDRRHAQLAGQGIPVGSGPRRSRRDFARRCDRSTASRYALILRLDHAGVRRRGSDFGSSGAGWAPNDAANSAQWFVFSVIFAGW